MSYSKFLDAAGDYNQWRKTNNLPDQGYEKNFEDVRDKWIEEERYRELIAFILENWDSGNCDDFIPPLVDALIEQKQLAHYKRLYNGVIRFRVNKLWRYANEGLDWQQLDQIDLSDFNMYRHESYQDRSRAAAFHRKFTLEAIDQFLTGLEKLNDRESIDRLLVFREGVVRLRKPKPKPTSDKRKIDEHLFWQLISEARTSAQDPFDFLDKLETSLSRFHSNEIRKFQRIFLQRFNELNSWDLWALAYIVRRGCGDDGFDYFRSWVISKGELIYNRVKSLDYATLSDLFDEDPQLEEFMYLAEKVFETKTGDIMSPVRVKQQKIVGQKWDEDKLGEQFPELCRMFEFEKN